MKAPILFLLATITTAAAAFTACNKSNVEPTDGGKDGDVSGDGGCASDSSTCNSCTSLEADPYNACTSAVTGCVPFDDTRVPRVEGELPAVP